MKRTDGPNRRDFLKQTAAAAAVGLTGCAAGEKAAPGGPTQKVSKPKPRRAWSPNDTVGVGYIAVGRRARGLMGLPKGARIVAISDVNESRLDEIGKNRPWKKYPDYRKMLEDKDVDAVIVSTPDHWHALNSIHAMQAGKDVYCEKPMTLTVREGRLMVEAARKYNRVFQTGSQQRSMHECRLGCELIRNGRIGKIKVVHGACYPSPFDECTAPGEPVPKGLNWDMWCGQTQPRPFNAKLYLPRPHPTGWISYRPYSGGEMTGWGAHGLDIIQWALGMDESGPVEVWPTGTGLKCQVSFRYANGIVVHLDNKAPGGGGLFEGERGKILVARRKLQTWPEEIAKEPLKSGDVHLQRSDNHIGNWIDCIRSGKKPVADVEIGHRSATMCHLGNIARWTGRRLRWDPGKETFPGDKEANALLERPMRAPYTL